MKNHNTSTKNSLVNQIDYLEKVNSKVYYNSNAYKMLLFAMQKDQVLKPHSAPMDTPLIMLEGEAKITIGKDIRILNKGESIILPKNIDHGVYPISNTKFLLIK